MYNSILLYLGLLLSGANIYYGLKHKKVWYYRIFRKNEQPKYFMFFLWNWIVIASVLLIVLLIETTNK